MHELIKKSTFSTPLLIASVVTSHKVASASPKQNYHTTMSVPTFASISKEVTNEQAAADFLVDHGVLSFPDLCPKCSSPLHHENTVDATKQTYWNVHCQCRVLHKDGKTYKMCITKETIFSGTHIKKRDFIMFSYLWLLNAPIGVMQKIVGILCAMAMDWNNYLMEVVSLAVTAAMEDSVQIGGVGSIVKLDKSKFGKCKYNVSNDFGSKVLLCHTWKNSHLLSIPFLSERTPSRGLLGVWWHWVHCRSYDRKGIGWQDVCGDCGWLYSWNIGADHHEIHEKGHYHPYRTIGRPMTLSGTSQDMTTSTRR